ncbi:MAG: MFS transporter, partial [Pseudomonadota bacterium]
LGADRTVAAGTLGTALSMVAIGAASHPTVAVAACALAGLSWIAVLSSLNVSAQSALPDWVRARGLSVFLTVFFGSMSLGSLAWGQVASFFGLTTALLVAAAGALVAIPLVRRVGLQSGEGQDLSPSMHWPAPVLAGDMAEDSPVMIQIGYHPSADRLDAFLPLMRQLAASRRRGGGHGWSLMRDAAAPDRYVESWWEASWLAHQRQHQRVSRADEALQRRIQELLEDGRAPDVRHFVTPR